MLLAEKLIPFQLFYCLKVDSVRAKNGSPVMKSHFLALAKVVSPSCLCSREKEEDSSSLPSRRCSGGRITQSRDREAGGGRDYPSKPPPGGQGADFIFAAENECTVYGTARFPRRSHPLCCSVHAPRSGDTFSWCRSLPPPEPSRFSVV